MEDYLVQTIDRYKDLYKQLTGQACYLKPAHTPFLSEDTMDCDARRPSTECPWCNRPFGLNAPGVSPTSGDNPQGCAAAPSMSDHVGDSAGPTERATLTKKKKKSLKGASTQPDTAENPQDGSRGRLATCASSILMQVMYAARMARHDLMRPTLRLATKITEWDDLCDRKLHRLIRYISTSRHKRLIGWVGDGLHDCFPVAYADSDYAGCEKTMRSTTGAAMLMEGHFTRFPIAARSLRQTSVANSMPEAEMVACHWTYRHIILPTFEIWDAFLPVGWRISFYEDNQAMCKVVQSGRNPTMKTLKRCHGVSLSFLHERLSDAAAQISGSQRDPVDLKEAGTDHMAADIYTKAFTNPEKWETACQLVHIINKDDLCQFLRRTVSAERVNTVPNGDNPQGEDSQQEPLTACAPCARNSFVAAPAPLCHIPGISNSKPILFRPPRSVQTAEKNANLKGKWFANVFGGTFGLAKAFCHEGLLSEGWDRESSTGLDLLDPRVVDWFKMKIRQGRYVALSFDFPCVTWSRARRPNGKGPRPLRGDTPSDLFGFSDLQGTDLLKVQEGNRLLAVVEDIIKLRIPQQIVVFLENPQSSRLWLTPALRKLMAFSTCIIRNAHFCQYGKQWKKPARFAFWIPHSHQHFHLTLKQCTVHNGLCSKTQQPHRILEGRDVETGLFWTKIAEPYPGEMCRDIATAVMSYRLTSTTTANRRLRTCLLYTSPSPRDS